MNNTLRLNDFQLVRHGLIERNACGKLRFSREGAQK